MNCRKAYFKIIRNRRDNPLKGCYLESHHIIPRSLGGKDFITNLVSLTAREHFIVHWLLSKMFTDKVKKAKMIMAFAMMLVSAKNQNRYKFTSRQFQYLRELHSNSMKLLQAGEKNSQFGKIWITDGESNDRIDEQKELPLGWVRGRTLAKKDILNKKEAKRLETKRDKEFKKEYYTELYSLYCDKGWNEVSKIYKNSKPNFVMQCKKYVESFKPQNGKQRGKLNSEITQLAE